MFSYYYKTKIHTIAVYVASTVHITTLLHFTVPLTSLLQICEKSLILLSFYSSKVGLYSSLPVKPGFTLLGPKVMTFGVRSKGNFVPRMCLGC